MSVDVTLIVESDGHTDGKIRMERTVHRGSSNARYYPGEVEHSAVDLVTWAAGALTSLVGGIDQVLSSKGAVMVVLQSEHRTALVEAQRFRDLTSGYGDTVVVGREELAELKRRDALLSAMEAAGVDNWEGMDNVVRPED